MHSVEECDVVIFICDAAEGLVDQDLKIINMICEMGKPTVVALNKMDLLSKKEKEELYESKRAQSNFVADFIKVEISGIKGTGLKRLFRVTNNVIDRAQKKYRKYLENSFRASLKLQSIQLKLIFRKSENPFENKVNKLTERQVKKRQRMMKHVRRKK